jgi:diguanylate cyclase (GGDEF)-like protein
MTTTRLYLRDLTSQEYRAFLFPNALAGLLVLLALLLNIGINSDIPPIQRNAVIAISLGAAIYITVYSFYIIPIRKNKDLLIWFNAFVSGAGFWALTYFLQDELIVYQNLLLYVAVISVSTFSKRPATLTMILLASAAHFFFHPEAMTNLLEWVRHLGVPFVAVLIAETAIRIQDISRQQVQRLETINEFSREIASILDREQIVEQLKVAIPAALRADSYFISMIKNDEATLLLCFDEGEFFPRRTIPAQGTLTNWVVQNQKELFLPDLRQPINLEGIQHIIVGKEKTSLSWIGVPMISPSFKGVLALAAYQPNAFNLGDLELLSNLASHATLAFENAARHAEVEERARLDSLTGVYNHGYFLQILQKHAADSLAYQSPLSVIMLDVDFFKQYNDTYGHLAGDTILTLLCETIRRHIKNADAVGRWGGEEFIISLPNTNAAQALVVAQRISASMRKVTVQGREGKEIPSPTVSQGIAFYPTEAGDIFKLIDLADQRLYVAKNRGRDQIEAVPN